MTTGATSVGEAADQRDPERLALVVRLDGATDAGTSRFVLVREGEDGPLQLLDVAPSTSGEPVEEVVADVLRTRLGIEPVGEALLSPDRRPRRTARWREGHVGTGWVRAVAVTVADGLDPTPPLTGAEALPLGEAEAALSTSLERALLRDGAALLGE